ncbi:cation-chloride co-transporter 1 [Actinidia rufa]|uniref:Cation-chloride co-transporter 1 n=1 Tax=Actinidia rufa TaxID=165716 RepID=A0A7J0E0B1_9ERIC|nr:cation-chloride co-transporter 1 [Actinidia rufa]
MDNGEIEGSDDNEFASPQGVRGGRKYRPVVAHDNDRAVVEMSSLDPGSSSSASFPNRESSLNSARVWMHQLSCHWTNCRLTVPRRADCCMRRSAWDLCGDGKHSDGRKSPELEVEVEEERVEAITRERGWQWRSFAAKGGVDFAKESPCRDKGTLLDNVKRSHELSLSIIVSICLWCKVGHSYGDIKLSHEIEASLEGNPPLSALLSLKWMMELQELLASLDSTPMHAHLHGFSLQLPCYLA